jgi:hypothetical protein
MHTKYELFLFVDSYTIGEQVFYFLNLSVPDGFSTAHNKKINKYS